MQQFKAQLHYHLREKQWKTSINFIEAEMKLGRDPSLNFYRSICYFKMGQTIDAMRDCKISQNTRDFRFSSTLGLLHYMENSSAIKDNSDYNNLTELKDKLLKEFKTLSVVDILSSMRFFTYIDDLDKYLDIEEMYDNNFNNNNGSSSNGEDLIVKGWSLCYSNNEEDIKESLDLFIKYLSEFGENNLDAVLGKFKALERLKRNEEVLDNLAMYIDLVSNSSNKSTFVPLIIEKCRIHLNLSEFENAIDYIKSEVSTTHFEISKILAVCYLINEGDVKEANNHIDKMWDLLSSQEPNNPELYYNTAKLFSRLCDKNPLIIGKCEIFISKAISFQPKNSDYLIEKALYNLILGELNTSEKLLSEAYSIDQNNKLSLIRQVFIDILKGNIVKAKEEIKKIIEYYKSLNSQIPPELMLYDLSLNIKDFNNNYHIENKKSSNSLNYNALFKNDNNTYIEKIEELFLPIINNILNKHISNAKQSYFSKYDLIISTNYDFLCDLVRICLDFFSINGDIYSVDDKIPNILQKAKKIIESIIGGGRNKYFISAMLLNCKLRYILGEKSTLINLIETIIKQSPSSYVDAYVLYAIICNDNKDYVKSKEIIQDSLLNCSKKAKLSIYFWITKTNYEIGLNDLQNAENSLKEALSLVKNKDTILESESKQCKVTSSSLNLGLGLSSSPSLFEFKSSDKDKLLVLQVELYLKQGRLKEAQTLINELVTEGAQLGDNILLLNAEVALKNSDVKKAVSLLKKIKPLQINQNLFISSRQKLADIYLMHLVDRRLYSWCYTEILENYKSLDNLKLAAWAEMKIDSPATAVSYYKQALSINPEDLSVSKDLGKALIQTHDYYNAEIYLKDKIEEFKNKLNENNIADYMEILEDFSMLLKKLGLDKLENYLNLISFLEESLPPLQKKISIKYNDNLILKFKISKLLFLLASTCRLLKNKDPNNYNKDNVMDSNSFNQLNAMSNIVYLLEEANKLNKEFINKYKDKSNNLLEEAKNSMSLTSFEIGNYYDTIESNSTLSEKFYLESLNYSNNTSEKALTALINLFIKNNKLNDAQKYADILIRINENSEENIKLLITVISNRLSNEDASNYLEKLVVKELSSFKLLEVYIELVRRTGKIYKAKEILSKCEKKLKFAFSPGLIYCKGLYLRYTNETNLSLNEFCKIKTDEYYGVKCIEQMLELYINPDNNIFMLELISPVYANSNSTNSYNKKDTGINQTKEVLSYNVNDINFEAVKFLLKELLQKRDDDNTKIYECWVSLLLRDSKFVLKVIEKLQDILSRDNENISAWVLLALSNIIIGKETEAKVNLKFLEKSSVNNIKFYNDYERGYLLLSYIAIKNNNYPKAIENLKKILNNLNIAQVKAYEYLGIIYEKECNYKEVCNYLEKAWEFSNQNSAIIGYKLAVSYVNNRNPIKAVNICNEVIKKYPNYPIYDLCSKAKTYLN